MDLCDGLADAVILMMWRSSELEEKGLMAEK
jgi:hypothetical protein